MQPFRLLSIIFLLFLFPVQETFAQGGGHKPEEKKDVAAMDSIYSVKENDSLVEPAGENFDNVFSPTDLFTADELVSPMPMGDMKMEGGEHAGHQEPQIELSHHELVSSSSKGFGTAVGITLFAGLVFAGFTFLRLGE